MLNKWIYRLTNNWSLKIIALFVAFFIWLFVTNNNDPVGSITISNVPITIVNEDSIADIGKVVEPEGSGTVTLKVTERRSVRSRLARNGSNFYVEADLENINQMNTVPLTVVCDNSAVTWDEIAISPSSLKVTLEDKVEQAFAVTVSPSGDVRSGYAVGKTEVAGGKNLLIAGPESLVGIINQVVAPINVTGLSTDGDLTSNIRIFDRNGSEFTESQLSRLEIKDNEGNVLTDRVLTVSVQLWKIRADVPIRVLTDGEPAEGYHVKEVTTVPQTVSLAGTSDALELVSDSLTVIDEVPIYGASDTIIQDMDLTDTLSGYTGLKLVGDVDPVISVTVQIEKTGDTYFNIPLGDITLVNKPEQMKLVFTPADKISVGVHELEEADGQETAEAISEQDIRLSIDLMSCHKEGTYELPVTVELPDGFVLSSPVVVKVSASLSQESLEEIEKMEEMEEQTDEE